MDIILGFALIAGFFVAAAVFIIRCNRRMTPEQRREADAELWIW